LKALVPVPPDTPVTISSCPSGQASLKGLLPSRKMSAWPDLILPFGAGFVEGNGSGCGSPFGRISSCPSGQASLKGSRDRRQPVRRQISSCPSGQASLKEENWRRCRRSRSSHPALRGRLR